MKTNLHTLGEFIAKKARSRAATVGHRKAAEQLKKQGFTLDMALVALLGTRERGVTRIEDCWVSAPGYSTLGPGCDQARALAAKQQSVWPMGYEAAMQSPNAWLGGLGGVGQFAGPLWCAPLARGPQGRRWDDR